MTAQGHPRAIFHRAIERRNLMIAETTAREIGSIDLTEALELVCLVAEKDPKRFKSYARRWLLRLIAERPLTLAEIDVAVTGLRALPAPRAAKALRALL